MRISIVLLTALAAAGTAAGQKTRTEVVRPTTPAHDARSNSPEVPEVYAVGGQFQRILMLRYKHQADLLAGLERMVKEYKVRNAVILAGAGSVRSYHYHAVSNRTFPSKVVFVKDPAAPADIASMNGYIMNGRIHAHITFTDEEKAFGGHLEPGTTVFTFAVATIGVLADDLDMSRFDDKTHR